MVVSGVNLASDFDGIKLPVNAEVRRTTEGALPEVEIDGVAYLVSETGDLHRRVVNNGRHVAIEVMKPVAKPKKKNHGNAKR
jgi:hypothetical protein